MRKTLPVISFSSSTLPSLEIGTGGRPRPLYIFGGSGSAAPKIRE